MQMWKLRFGEEKGLVQGPTVGEAEARFKPRESGSGELGPWPLLCHLSSREPSLGFQIGHRDFDVEKRLRRDLKRTHTLLSDVQLLLGSMEDSKTSVSKEELEKVHSQVGVVGPLRTRLGRVLQPARAWGWGWPLH